MMTKALLLQKWGISGTDYLGHGMEAEVYSYGKDQVFKLYAGTLAIADLYTLQDFYVGLIRPKTGYALPKIKIITQVDDYLVTIEKRLIGTPLSTYLPTLTTTQLDAVMHRYLTATLALSEIQTKSAVTRYKLFDPTQISLRVAGDWHQFLSRYLEQKSPSVTPYLSRDVAQFEHKLQQLYALLAQPYHGAIQLIHGDIYPGNLLVDADLKITALFDFGLLTMYGDYLFDVATSWVFFDMYDQLQANLRARYLAIVLDRLGATIRGKLYRYMLIYSVISADTYSATCDDGHYQWCVANLNNSHYWQMIE